MRFCAISCRSPEYVCSSEAGAQVQLPGYGPLVFALQGTVHLPAANRPANPALVGNTTRDTDGVVESEEACVGRLGGDAASECADVFQSARVTHAATVVMLVGRVMLVLRRDVTFRRIASRDGRRR